MPHPYVTSAELKETLSMTGETFADANITTAIESASQIVDEMTVISQWNLPQFGTTVTEARTFTPVSSDYLIVGPVSTITAVSQNGTALTSGDYYLDGGDTLRSKTAYGFTSGPQAISVTATWGYATIPAAVKDATSIIATQILRRVRDAPFGILALSLDGPAIRLGRFDPQVDALLAPYSMSQMVE